MAYILSDERLSPGNLDLADTEICKDAAEVFSLLVSENFTHRQTGNPIRRHAVTAAQVASVCDRKPDVIDCSVKSIYHKILHKKFIMA
jgi:hypothetical protein